MKQLNLVTSGGVFPYPLARTKSLPKAKLAAEHLAYHGAWVTVNGSNIFLAPNVIRMIEVTEAPEKVASEGTGIEPVPAPQIHDEEQEIPNE